MEKRKTLKRLIATGVMTAFTAASLITTSYAFVTLNTEATISEFGFDIVDQEGLLLSVDGSTFFQDIDGELIKSTILANQNKGYDKKIQDYSDLHFRGVTLGGVDKSYVMVSSEDSYVAITDSRVNATNVTDYYVVENEAYVAATTFEDNATYYRKVLATVNSTNYANYYTYNNVTEKFEAATSFSAQETYYKYVENLKEGVYSEEYSYNIGKYSQSIKDKRVTFVKDKLTEYSNEERSAILADKYYDTYSETTYDLVNENDVAYKHVYEAAEGRDYIFFDLWLRVAQNGVADSEDHPTYKLRFSKRTSIIGKAQDVELYNKLSTPTALDVTGENTIRRVGGQVGDKRADGSTIEAGKFVAGDYIKVNPADAMRLGVTVLGDNKITNQTIKQDSGYYTEVTNGYVVASGVDDSNVTNYFVKNNDEYVSATAYDENETYYITVVNALNVTKYYIKNTRNEFVQATTYDNSATYYSFSNTASDINVKVYEPSVGLGSYAITGNTDNKYNPTLNAMYTYNNSLFPLSPYIKGVTNYGQLTTYSKFLEEVNKDDNPDNNTDDDVLATFTWDGDRKEYNVVKMSVMLWLEGWDADYFVGMRETAISVKLGFKIDTK